VTRERVVAALQTILDPELSMSIAEVGLVYDVRVDGGRVAITMAPIAPGCPIHDSMEEWAQRAVRRVAGVNEVEVGITIDRPWNPDCITLRPGTLG
jgi:metal-sulfur cluster biosynthetic enzyme